MNCHQKSESHAWRYSKHNKVRRCVKCKSKLPITKNVMAKDYLVKEFGVTVE